MARQEFRTSHTKRNAYCIDIRTYETERQEGQTVSESASRWLGDTRLARWSGAVAFWDWMVTSQRQCTEPSLFRPTCVIKHT
jgi:hypothetical protein